MPADEPGTAPDGATGENELPIIIDDPAYDETELDAPALVSVTNVNGGVKLTWKAVEGAAGYRVLRRTGGGEWSVLTSTAATTVTNKKNVVSGTAYTYTVCCLDADGGVISGYDPNGLTITYVAAPKLLGIANVYGGVKLTWEPVAGAAQYHVLRKAVGASKWSTVTTRTRPTRA